MKILIVCSGNSGNISPFICEQADVTAKIQMAQQFAQTKVRTNGSQRILDLGLDSESVAKRVVEVYKRVIDNGQLIIDNGQLTMDNGQLNLERKRFAIAD